MAKKFCSSGNLWIPVGMKIGKSIVFEVENQKWRLKHSKRSGFSSNMGHIREKIMKMQLWQKFAVKKGISLQT